MIIDGHSSEHIATVRELFREHARALNIDLCFQNFERELAELPGSYAPPEGRLLLATEAGSACGCVAIRALSKQICEMKRLYVRPRFRGNGLGRSLAQMALLAARQRGYQRMRLDTLASMKEAQSLYRSLGFRTIQSYYDNPVDGVQFMELDLAV